MAAETTFLHEREDRVPETAGGRHDRDPARPERGEPEEVRGSERDETTGEVGDAWAVGADDHEVTIPCFPSQLVLMTQAIAADLGEARGENHQTLVAQVSQGS